MPDLSRRGFLRLLGVAGTVAAAPTYFLPPLNGWYSDTIINPNHYPLEIDRVHWYTGLNIRDVPQYTRWVKFERFAIESPLDPALEHLMLGLPSDL